MRMNRLRAVTGSIDHRVVCGEAAQRAFLHLHADIGDPLVRRGEKLPSLETLLTLLNQLNVSADMVLCDVLNTGYAIKGSQLSEQLAGCDKKVQDRVLAVVATLLRHP